FASPSEALAMIALFLFPSGFVLARLSLVFPAAALGYPLPLRAAWRLTRGNTWKLGIAFGLPTLVCAAIAAGLQNTIPHVLTRSLRSQVFSSPWASWERVLVVGLTSRFLSYVLFACLGAVAAVVYRE